MAFNPNIPLVTDPILQSAKQMKANFQAINDAFSSDHVGLTQDQTISGKHNQLTLRPQSGDPTTSATQVALYNKLVSSIPELFYMPNNAQPPIQMTYPSIQTGLQSIDPDVYYPTQYSFIAGPFVIYGGIIKNPITELQLITLSPTTTLLFVNLIATNIKNFSASNSYNVNAVNLSGSTFQIDFGFPNVFDVYYTAIGM